MRSSRSLALSLRYPEEKEAGPQAEQYATDQVKAPLVFTSRRSAAHAGRTG